MTHVLWQDPFVHLFSLPGDTAPDRTDSPDGSPGTLRLWLPRALVPGSAEDAARPLLLSDLGTRALDPADAALWLAALPESPDDSDSLSFWRTLSRFAITQIRQRQFIPQIFEDSPSRLTAAWRPAITGAQQVRWLDLMAHSMPPICRALATSDPDVVEPDRLIVSFLAAATDGMIRRVTCQDDWLQSVFRKGRASGAGPELRWVAGLLTDDNSVPPGIEESDDDFLFTTARQWIGRLEEADAAAQLRLCFVLHEPPEGSDTLDEIDADPRWLLTTELHSPDASAAPIDVAKLFDGAMTAGAIIGRTLASRRQRYVDELGRAAEFMPALRSLLSPPIGATLELSTVDANVFMRHTSTQLRDRDFVVVLPEWAATMDADVGLRLSVRPDEMDIPDEESALDAASPRAAARNGDAALPAGRFGLDSLLEFDWRIAVGGSDVTVEHFQKLVEAGKPLVRHNGRWVHLDLDKGKQALEFLRKSAQGEMTFGTALRAAYGLDDSETGLPVLGMTATSWIESLLNQAPDARIVPLEQPAAFTGTLRPYQLRGLQWLVFLDRLGIGGCLADDMGLGKTIQLIALMLHDRRPGAEATATSPTPLPPMPAAQPPAPEAADPAKPRRRAAVGPTLLFAPTSVVGNWQRELQRFAPELKVILHHGPQRLEGEAFIKLAQASDIVITTYSLARRDQPDLQKVRWYRLALDEAQKIKSPQAASTQAIRAIYAPRRVALTGTPIENHLSELWSIMEVLNPGLLGSAGDFRERFANPIERLGDKEVGDRLRRMIRPFVLRRTKSDPAIAGDLPEKMEMRVFCNLTAEQASYYERIVGQAMTQIDSAEGIRRRGLILSALTRLKQICNHPSLISADNGPYDGRSGKCERLMEMVEELLDEGDAALIFTQYRQMGHILEKMIPARLNGAKVQFLHGGTPQKERDNMIDRFQRGEGGIRLFLLSLRAGGLGLNLTAANHVFHFDRWWNPAVESQATDRAHRFGQTRKVQVHKFVCVGTMEERIDRMLQEKLQLADKIVGSGDDWLTSLSTEQLREYLSLSKDAVGEF